MDRLKQATIETYDRRAPELAEYFRGIGPRDEDINHVFELLGSPDNPRVLEIGCGDGRDAKAILQQTTNYLGLDISSGMVDIARQYAPKVILSLLMLLILNSQAISTPFSLSPRCSTCRKKSLNQFYRERILL